MGKPAWSGQGRFTTLFGRKQNEKELDERMGQWTSLFSAEELTMMLQAKGISAGVVKNGLDVCHDPQLAHRGQWKEIAHKEIGNYRYDMPGYVLPRTPPDLERPAPCLGEHNEYVCTKILGMEKEVFTRLEAEGILA